jgi:hypothetical protein
MLEHAISYKVSRDLASTQEKLISLELHRPFKQEINPYLKEAILKAYNEAINKREFKALVKKYAKLTKSGFDSEILCVELLSKFK